MSAHAAKEKHHENAKARSDRPFALSCSRDPPVVFPARARVVQTDVGHRRIFESKCGRYRIVETRYSCKKLAARWYAMKRDQLGWTHVEKFRKHYLKYDTCLAAIQKDAVAEKRESRS